METDPVMCSLDLSSPWALNCVLIVPQNCNTICGLHPLVGEWTTIQEPALGREIGHSVASPLSLQWKISTGEGEALPASLPTYPMSLPAAH